MFLALTFQTLTILSCRIFLLTLEFRVGIGEIYKTLQTGPTVKRCQVFTLTNLICVALEINIVKMNSACSYSFGFECIFDKMLIDFRIGLGKFPLTKRRYRNGGFRKLTNGKNR